MAALFIERQWLDRPRGRRLTAASLSEFAERAGGVQLDSINVLDRAHYLTLWSRFGEYPRDRLDELVYRRRTLFEYWSHAACLVPSAHAWAWRRAMLDYRTHHTGWTRWLRKNQRVLRAVEDAVRASGPLGNSDLGKRAPGARGGWWSWKPTTHAFHYLWMSGRLLVRDRVHFQKRFDLAERVLPQLSASDPPSWPEFLRWHLRRSFKAMGAATETDLRMYLSFPKVGLRERRQALESLMAEGEVLEVPVQGERGRWLALAEDLPALEAAARRRRPALGTTLLSPFDSFLWHRERVSKLFGFDYRIEVYTPGHRRVHGYYSLPIYHDGSLLGRVDAKNHRAQRWLEVRHVHLEPWIAKSGEPPATVWGSFDRPRALAGLGDALASLSRFLGAERVTCGRVTPTRLRGEVTAAIRSAASRSRATIRSAATSRSAAAPEADDPSSPAGAGVEGSHGPPRRARGT